MHSPCVYYSYVSILIVCEELVFIYRFLSNCDAQVFIPPHQKNLVDLIQKEKKKKEEEEAGFDPLKAREHAEGLTAGGSNHSIAHQAIGQTQALAQKHHLEKTKQADNKFVSSVSEEHKKSVSIMRGKLSLVTPKKLSIPTHAYMPNQLKKPIDKPESSKGGSGKKA